MYQWSEGPVRHPGEREVSTDGRTRWGASCDQSEFAAQRRTAGRTAHPRLLSPGLDGHRVPIEPRTPDPDFLAFNRARCLPPLAAKTLSVNAPDGVRSSIETAGTPCVLWGAESGALLMSVWPSYCVLLCFCPPRPTFKVKVARSRSQGQGRGLRPHLPEALPLDSARFGAKAG